MTKILVLNYPDNGRYSIVETDKTFYEIEDVLQFLHNTKWDSDIVLVSPSERSFDWWIVNPKETD